MHSWHTRIPSVVLVVLLFTADVTCSLLAALSVHGWSWASLNAAWPSGLGRFSSDAVDGLLLAAFRLVVLVGLALAAIRWGTPAHELAADKRKKIVKQRDEVRRKWNKQHGLPEDDGPLTQGDEEQRAGVLPPSVATTDSPVLPVSPVQSLKQPLLNVQEQQQARVLHSSAAARVETWDSSSDLPSSLAAAREAFERTLPPLPPELVLSDPEKLVLSRRAAWWRRLFVALLFGVATCLQAYLGVKLVGFRFTNEWTQGVLMAAVIICINAEQSVLRHIIEHLTQEEGYLILALHPHRVHFDESSVGHWGPKRSRCDLCRSRIRASYRCRKCDFDCCDRCFSKKDKARGEGQLRGDKGAREELEVSSTGYMLRALKLARPHSTLIGVAVVCLLATSAASIALPNYQGKIIDDVVKGRTETFKNDVKLFVLISVGLGLFGGVRSLAFNIVGAHISNDVRNRLFKSIVVQDISFFDGVATGELTSRLSSDTAAMTSPMQTVLSATLSNILMLGGGFVMCIVTSWRLTVLAMTSIYPIIIITRAYSSWSSLINKQIWAALGDASTVANQAISNIRTVRSFGTEQREIGKYTAATGDALDKSIRDAYANGGTYALTNYLDLATSVLLLWYGGSVAMGEFSGSLTVGKLITFQLYWGQMNSAYSSLISVLNSFTRASGAAQRVLTLMDSLPDINPEGGVELEEVKGELRLDNVSFAYQMRPDNPVLKGVSLTIPANSVFALVGRSGGGKSTIVALLQRFYDVQQGRILLDGNDFKDLKLSSLHSHMAVVTQTTELFAGTIKENLIYGLEDGKWSMSDVEDACRQANAHDFIMQFEEGYETRVGERGVRLSGGQKQRLSIARAMLRKARLLYLDEATSSLDAESEALVQEALDALIARGHCTILLVAHRLSTVMNAHQIAVLDGGKIAESGTHDELVQRGGIYARLVQRQLARKANLIEEEEHEASSPKHAAASGSAGSKAGAEPNGADGAAAASASRPGMTRLEREASEQARRAKLDAVDNFDALFEEDGDANDGAAAQTKAGTKPSPSPSSSPVSGGSTNSARARRRSPEEE